MSKTIVRWSLLPVLLVASLFSRYAASYELLVDFVIYLGAIVFVQRRVQLHEYFWAAGFIAIALVFSPLLLAVKIILFMVLTCIAMAGTLFAAFRTQPVLASHTRGS